MATQSHPLDSRITRRALIRRIGLGSVVTAGWRLETMRAKSGVAAVATPSPVPPIGAPGRRHAGQRIELAPDRHVPLEISVPVGATVAWVNRGPGWIAIAALDGSFDSGRIASGQEFVHSFDRPGSITYVCENHPIRDMTGRISVR